MPEVLKEGRKTCHKTPYERHAAARRIAVSVMYKAKVYCEQCQAWHLTK